MEFEKNDERFMRRALELASRGEGLVEPNPMVGCVIARDGQIVGQGFHERFGGPHAEVNAIQAAGDGASGATAFVTLEPCCHLGKTPPCTDALIAARVARVVIGMTDPFEKVRGQGIAILEKAGIDVSVGLLAADAEQLNAPYCKRIQHGMPWMIAKWAMTWDGKMATRRGDSKWISNDASREIVHGIRGRVDAIMVGSGTAAADDPLLTARPPGARVATRIVVDSRAELSEQSQLVATASEAPVLIAAGPQAEPARIDALKKQGCEVWVGQQIDRRRRLHEFLTFLAERKMTNVLVEGGSKLLGSLRNLGAIDEVHLFLGGKLFGGGPTAITPVGIPGVDSVEQANPLTIQSVRKIDNDVYVVGRVSRPVDDTPAG